MLRTRENSDVFNSLDEIYLVFTSKKQISSMYTFICLNLARTCANYMCLQIIFQLLLEFCIFFFFQKVDSDGDLVLERRPRGYICESPEPSDDDTAKESNNDQEESLVADDGNDNGENKHKACFATDSCNQLETSWPHDGELCVITLSMLSSESYTSIKSN